MIQFLPIIQEKGDITSNCQSRSSLIGCAASVRENSAPRIVLKMPKNWHILIMIRRVGTASGLFSLNVFNRSLVLPNKVNIKIKHIPA